MSNKVMPVQKPTNGRTNMSIQKATKSLIKEEFDQLVKSFYLQQPKVIIKKTWLIMDRLELAENFQDEENKIYEEYELESLSGPDHNNFLGKNCSILIHLFS